jgi:hypothetical protein
LADTVSKRWDLLGCGFAAVCRITPGEITYLIIGLLFEKEIVADEYVRPNTGEPAVNELHLVFFNRPAEKIERARMRKKHIEIGMEEALEGVAKTRMHKFRASQDP